MTIVYNGWALFGPEDDRLISSGVRFGYRMPNSMQTSCCYFEGRKCDASCPARQCRPCSTPSWYVRINNHIVVVRKVESIQTKSICLPICVVWIFQGHGNIYTSAERKSGLGNIGHAVGFYERRTDIRARGNRIDRIRLHVLCPYSGKIRYDKIRYMFLFHA